MPQLRTMQPSFTAGELSPALWARVDLAKYQVGLKQAKNVFIYPHGGVANRPGLEYVGEVKDSAKLTRLIPFQYSPDQSYILEFGDQYHRVYKDGELIVTAAPSAISGITVSADATVTTAAPHGLANGAEVYMTGIVGPSALNGRRFRISGVTANTFKLNDLFGVLVSSLAMPAYVSGGTVRAVYETASPYLSADLRDVVAAQELNQMFLAHNGYAPRKLTRIAENNWTMATMTFQPSINPPATVTAAIGVKTTPTGYVAKDYFYKVSAVKADSGEESLPSPATVAVSNDLLITGNTNIISWAAVAGAERYLVYKFDNGAYGYIGGTDALSLTDDNITADLADQPQQGRNPFIGSDNYPRCVGFTDDGRLGFGGTKANPTAMYLSQSSNYENFGTSSPAKAADSITFRIRSKKLNEIRSFVPAKGLLVFTSVAEWVITGGNDGFLSPSNITRTNQGYRGASVLQPINIGNTILFAQRTGGVVRDMAFQFSEDGYTGNDLTVLARHLFIGRRIVAWDYAQSPHSIVWCVLDDGSLVSLTYMREHEVWGWTRHETDGAFEDVAVIPHGEEDQPYFIVRRTVKGQTKRYIERLRSREVKGLNDCFFVDSGLTYSGAPATVITGLWHLEGKTVTALADGNVVRGLTVNAGQVTLPNAASVVHVGLPYTAEIETLELDLGAVRGLGTVQGRVKSVSAVNMRVEKSRGMFIGPERNKMREWKQRAFEAYGSPIELFTGDFLQRMDADWNTSGNVVIQQRDPLPMAVLAVMPEIAIGG